MNDTERNDLNRADLEKAIIFLLEALADILAAGGPPFKSAMEELRKALKASALLDPATLKRHAFNLSEALSQIKARAESGVPEIKPGPTSAEAETRVLAAMTGFLENLIRIVGSLRPALYQERERSLIKSLRDGRPLDELFDALTAFVVIVREDVWSEKTRAISRIGEILKELETAESGFFNSATEAQAHFETSERSFTQAVADGLQGLGSLIGARPVSLDDLCLQLAEKVNKLHVQVELKNKTDQTRYETLSREWRAAARRLAKTKRDYEEFNAQSHEMLREIENLRAISLRDPLTGIYNRRAYDRQIAATLVALDAEKLKTFGVAVFDIDHFRTFNNSYGHLAGDMVLQHVARVTSETLRADDLFFRYGGDEFVIVMPNATLQAAWSVAEKVRLNIGGVEFKVFKNSDQVVKLTISMGVAEAVKGDDPVILFQRADKALYAAKKAGRDRALAEPPLDSGPV